MAQAHERIVETAQDARQGHRDRPVLVVVATGLGLAILGMAAVWLGFFAR